MNIVDTKKIDNYIKKCFHDSFVSENREMSIDHDHIEYIMIRNNEGKWQIYLFIDTRYERVSRRTKFRITYNIKKNFGILYRDSESLKCIFYDTGIIDYNYTEMMFRNNSNGRFISLSIFDNEAINRPEGEFIPAHRFEKLLIKHLEQSGIQVCKESFQNESLPEDYNYDWDKFTELYEATFNQPLGKGYEVITSSGIEML